MTVVQLLYSCLRLEKFYLTEFDQKFFCSDIDQQEVVNNDVYKKNLQDILEKINL